MSSGTGWRRTVLVPGDMSRVPRILCAATLLLSLSATGLSTWAQQARFREDVDLVRIDVVALDDQRRPVRNLTADDFSVRVNGVAATVRAFAAVDLRSAASPENTATWKRAIAPDVQTNRSPDEGRLVVIFFDRSIPPGPKLLTARRIAAAAVNELQPGDLAAVIGVRLWDVQNFTSDRARLLRAISGAIPGTAEGPDEAAANGRASSVFRANEACVCNACVLDQIRQVAQTLRGVSRRKILLFIGSQITVGTDDIDPAGGIMSPVSVACSEPIRQARTALYRELDVSSLSVYSIDPSGLETPGLESLHSEGLSGSRLLAHTQGSLRILPDRTGGRAVMNTNAPEALVPAVMSESAVYYMIGFDATATRGERARIEITSKRQGISVLTQRAYEPAPAAAPGRGRDASAGAQPQPASAASARVLPVADVPVSVNVLPMMLPSTHAPGVLVVMGLPHAGLDSATSLRPQTSRFDLLIGAFDMRSRPRLEDRRTVEIDATKAALRQYSDVVSPLPLRPGAYEIRVGAGTTDGRAGSVITYVDVPDFRREPISLSGLAVSVMPEGASTVVGGRLDMPFIPTAQRTFRRPDILRGFLRVYLGDSHPIVDVDVQVTLTDTRDRDVVNEIGVLSASRFGPDRSAEYGTQIPLATLAPGNIC